MTGDPEKVNRAAPGVDDDLDDEDEDDEARPGMDQGTPQKVMSLFLVILLTVVWLCLATVPLVILYTIASVTWRAANY